MSSIARDRDKARELKKMPQFVIVVGRRVQPTILIHQNRLDSTQLDC